MQLYLSFYFKNSTCFGRSPCLSSGVTLLHRQPLVYHTVTNLYKNMCKKGVILSEFKSFLKTGGEQEFSITLV
jgi:hypothetical protein